MNMKKKAILFILSIIMMCGGCSQKGNTGPQIIANGNIVTDSTEVSESEQKSESKEIIKTLVLDYVNRVYNIGENYSPDYVDESTSPEEAIAIAKESGTLCKVKNCMFANFEFVNQSESNVTAVLTMDYSDITVPSQEYFVPLSVSCQKIEGEWKVMDSFLGELFPTAEYDIQKNEVSGNYTFINKKG